MKVLAVVVAVLAAAAAMPQPALAIGNPAAVFCTQSGGKSIDLRDASGNEFGVCILPSGEMVEEWAYFRAQHKPAPQQR